MKTEILFGEFFKAKRRALGLSLREFCRRNGLDPGNISKIERGVLRPPESREKLIDYAAMLDILEGSDDWLTFFDVAAASRGKIPDELMENERLVRALPILFRALRKDKVADEEIEELLRVVRRAWRSEGS
jgi:transcriptional regulator with XRE-family HTH domain